MIALYLHQNDLDLTEWLNAVKFTFIKHSLDLAFNINVDLKQPAITFHKLINVTGNLMTSAIFAPDSARPVLLSKLRTYLTPVNPSQSSRRVAWSDAEKIRLMAGRRIYISINGNEKGIWSYLTKQFPCWIFIQQNS